MRRIRNDKLDHALLTIETEYITDPDRRSLEWWFESLSGKFSLESMRKYATENKWFERRQAFWRGVQAQWLRQRSQQLIQTRCDELKEAVELRAAVFHFCKPEQAIDGTIKWPIKPNSYEGMLRAFVQLDGVVEAKREAITQTIDPLLALVDQAKPQDEQDEEHVHDMPFDRDEMRVLAHGLLERRRTSRRAQLGIEDDDANDDDDTINNDDNEETTGEETTGEEETEPEAGEQTENTPA